MNAKIDFIEDIHMRYSSLEIDLDKKLKSIEEAETNLDEQFDTSDANTETNELDSYPQTLNEARKRNKKIIEDLEKAKARLRMRVMFSPLDEIHEKAENNYFAAIQTPLKKKYGPIFV
ncbi:unnamed protein product [Chironomus riparius]|uniref:Uncharacterized protein n=1 Tax=Chironomus riparius TaxID=315576 RepID=A0A9N9RI67_9DIPT|nr:unnamed protein product [Chironomus riparius]